MRNSILLLFLSMIALTGWAQNTKKEIPVQQAKVSALVPVITPIQFDTTDVKGHSFKAEGLLQIVVDFDNVRQSTNYVVADTSGVFALDAQKQAVQLLSFNVVADRYCKSTVNVTATDRFELYVDNKKVKTKETQEDSLAKAKAITYDLLLEPQRRYEVIIKRLTEQDRQGESLLKIFLQADKKDSLAQITISTDGKRNILISDLMEGKRVQTGSISPSGNYYLVNTNEVPVGGKPATALTELRELKTNKLLYTFSPQIRAQWISNTQLVYAKRGVEKRNLVSLDVTNFTETVLANEIDFSSFEITPNEKLAVLTLRQEIPADGGDLKRVLSVTDRSGGFRGRSNLFLYNIQDKTLQQITFGKTNLSVNDISFDSQKALVMASNETPTERPFRNHTLLELDLQTLQVDTLAQDAYLQGAIYSPDAKEILITAMPNAFNGVGLNISEGQIANLYDNQCFILNKATKSIEPVTKNFDPSIKWAEWSAYNKKIYFLSEEKDFVHVYEYNPQTKKYTLLDLPEEVVHSFSVAKTQPQALFVGESLLNSDRLYAYDLKTRKSTLLVDTYQPRLDELQLTPVNTWTFDYENTTIDGRYVLPPNFDPNKKYPLIVYYYGGTSPTSRIFETTFANQLYAALGYVVYTIQPSGTTGYGQEFSARHVNAWGTKTADEIIAGTKQFYREHAFVDSTKIGCMGASYGGFMTQYLQTKTDIFAAAVSHAGISSIASYWGEGYWGVGYSAAASANSYPWNNRELYVDHSPLFNADKIHTPLLLLHGMVDTNVPVGESIQLYNALKILGRPVEFVQVADENHAVSGYQHRIDWNKTIYAWFAKWLKDQPEWWNVLYPEK